MRFVRTLPVVAMVVSLAACAGGAPRGPSNTVIERALAQAPGEAQPSAIVATEIAYAQAAQEEGLFDAGRAFSLGNALQHARSGPVPFAGLKGTLGGPDAAPEWTPRVVTLSCDGATAVSHGRFRDAEGLVGNYVTVWARQPDLSYKWVYDVAGYDKPQPPVRPEFEDGEIVVTALNTIRGLAASCPRADAPVAAPPPLDIVDTQSGTQLSDDGTLRWHWVHQADGTRVIKADYWYEGGWESAIAESFAPQ
jgi:hypothetical protein